MTGFLLLHGTIVTVDRERRIIEDGALAINDDRIVDIGTVDELEPRHGGKEVIDCRGKLIIPGLIDAHGHAGHALLRSIAADTNAMWMKIITPTYYHYVTRDYWYADGLISGIERLRAGVTTGPASSRQCRARMTPSSLSTMPAPIANSAFAKSSASGPRVCPGHIPSRDGRAVSPNVAT